MEDFGHDFVEFFSGLTFWVTMAVMSAYCVGYVKWIQKAAAKKDRWGERGEGQIAHYGNVIFWERLRSFDFFAILYIVVCFSFLALPFALIILHAR